MRLGLSIAALVTVLDQLSKWFVMEHVLKTDMGIRITGFFNIVSAWNKGVSFSMFSSDHPLGPVILSVVALIIVACLVIWLKDAEDNWTIVALGLIIGGAVGNVIDRLRVGAVYDFLDFYINDSHWPAFNLADTCVSTGAGILLLHALFLQKDKEVNEEDE